MPEDDKSVNISTGNISDVSGEINIAGGHIIHAEKGATVIIGAPAEAVEGFVALRELMRRSSNVRSSMVEFNTDFKEVHEQVQRLGDYKDLHDLLHRLQLQCYNGVVQAATRFPNDEFALDNLTDYALTLEEIVEELKQIASRSSLPKPDLAWIGDVYTAKTDLRYAVDNLDETSLKKAIWRLNRILATHPSRINTLLNQSARALRLPALLSALTGVCGTLPVLDLDPNKVNAFRSGVDALGNLNQELSSLVDNHDHWQLVDIELRRIESSINGNLSELEMSWPDVKSMAEPLYIGLADEWASALKKECDALDQALAGNNPTKVLRQFRSYHRRVIDRFYRVDIELKSLCGDLRQIGIPLATVLEMVE